MKVAKIKNKFGKEFLVPIHTAKQMLVRDEIEDYKVEEVENIKNDNRPQTQGAFENKIVDSDKVPETSEDNSNIIKANEKLNIDLKKSNADKKALNTKNKDLEAEVAKLNKDLAEANKTKEEIKVPETSEEGVNK